MLLDCFRQGLEPFTYDWRTKAEPLLWYPDALAGIAREQLTDGQSAGFGKLQSARIISDVRYVRRPDTRDA